jgi:hypothetical protein
MTRRTTRYDWNDEDFTVSKNIDLPDDLIDIVSKAPKGDEAIGKYLKDLVANDIITIDDIDFLINSGALQN